MSERLTLEHKTSYSVCTCTLVLWWLFLVPLVLSAECGNIWSMLRCEILLHHYDMYFPIVVLNFVFAKKCRHRVFTYNMHNKIYLN